MSSWTHESNLKRDIKKVVTYIENRIEFTEQPTLVPALLKTAQDMVTRTKGIDHDRIQRLSLEKEIRGMGILMHKICK